LWEDEGDGVVNVIRSLKVAGGGKIAKTELDGIKTRNLVDTTEKLEGGPLPVRQTGEGEKSLTYPKKF